MYGTVNLRYDCGVGRVTGLKELGNTRQTTGDITSLTLYTRNLYKNVTGCKFLTVLDDNVATYRQVVGTQNLALGTDNIG